MKPWQKGIELTKLKDYEKIFESYNSNSASPFSQIKKNNIADAIDKGTFNIHDVWIGTNPIKKQLAYIKTICKKKTDIYLYPGVLIGTKLPGDVVYTGLATDHSDINTTSISGGIFNDTDNIWVTSWSCDRNLTDYLTKRKFKRIGSKITTFGEIQYVWFRNSVMNEKPREFPVLPKYEKVSVKRVAAFSTIANSLVSKIADKMNDMAPLFQNHYSNYNKGKSWSAFSLRGYKSDPTFMTKPIEMNDKWKEEHKNEVFEMQDTTLMEKFPEVYQLLGHTFGPGNTYHRIRLMKLKEGEGELTRHTDQVDPDQGLAVGKLARFHFPIITNPKVKFTVWDIDDVPNTVNMREGECWVLDVRKPHAAINGGTEDRIHLVVDIIVTPAIIKLLEAKTP